AEDLRQPERAQRLHNRRGADCERDHTEQIGLSLPDHLVDEITGRPGQDEAGEAVHQHERESDPEPVAMLPDELARLAPGVRVIRFGFFICHGGKVTQSPSVAPHPSASGWAAAMWARGA